MADTQEPTLRGVASENVAGQAGEPPVCGVDLQDGDALTTGAQASDDGAGIRRRLDAGDGADDPAQHEEDVPNAIEARTEPEVPPPPPPRLGRKSKIFVVIMSLFSLSRFASVVVALLAYSFAQNMTCEEGPSESPDKQMWVFTAKPENVSALNLMAMDDTWGLDLYTGPPYTKWHAFMLFEELVEAWLLLIGSTATMPWPLGKGLRLGPIYLYSVMNTMQDTIKNRRIRRFLAVLILLLTNTGCFFFWRTVKEISADYQRRYKRSHTTETLVIKYIFDGKGLTFDATFGAARPPAEETLITEKAHNTTHNQQDSFAGIKSYLRRTLGQADPVSQKSSIGTLYCQTTPQVPETHAFPIGFYCENMNARLKLLMMDLLVNENGTLPITIHINAAPDPVGASQKPSYYHSINRVASEIGPKIGGEFTYRSRVLSKNSTLVFKNAMDTASISGIRLGEAEACDEPVAAMIGGLQMLCTNRGLGKAQSIMLTVLRMCE